MQNRKNRPSALPDEGWSSSEVLPESDNPESILAIAAAKFEDSKFWQLQLPNYEELDLRKFFSVGFTHHILIMEKIKDPRERIFYINRCATENYSVEALKRCIASDDYHHQGALANNFLQTLPESEQAFRAVNAFKDEYLLDFINVEELGIRTFMIHTGVFDPAFDVDVTNEEIAAAAGQDIKEIVKRKDRAMATEALSKGMQKLVPKLYKEGKFDGILSFGGSGGTSLVTPAMRELPIGVPKVMVSTMADRKSVV